MKGAGIAVHVHDTKRKTSVDAVFYDFPVSVGRSEVSDLMIDDLLVSNHHVTLTLENGVVVVKDEGSRNGTVLGNGGGELKPGQAYDLSRVGNAFAIKHLAFTVAVVNTANRLRDDRERGGTMLSGRIGNTPDVARQPVRSPCREARAAVDALKSSYDTRTAVVASHRSALTAHFEGLPPEDRVEFVRLIAHEQPEVTDDPIFQSLAARLAVSMVELRSPETVRVEEASHRVLQELAAWYGVPTTLASLGDVIRFGRKLQDVCDALFSSVIPLRDGLKRFGQEIGVEHGAPKNEVMEMLDRARTERDVGTALLNSTTIAGDSWVAVRALCADYMMHSLSFPHAAMEGVRSLLAELAPHTIESQVGDQGWLRRGVLRADALWKFYVRRHADFASEDAETFRRLFGAEFAAAYSRVFTSAKDEEARRAQLRQQQVRPVLAGESRTDDRRAATGLPQTGTQPPAPRPNRTAVMRRAPTKPPDGY